MGLNDAFWDVTEEGDDFELPHPPSAIWLIFSLEFPAMYSGEKHILMTQPYYGNYELPENFGEGIWYPPFSAYPIELGYFPLRRLGDVRAKIEKTAEEKYHPLFIDEIAYNLGLGEPRHEELRAPPIEELKLSPRGHNVFKFFRIVRFRCWHPANAGKRNLTDPEGVKGFSYIPLNIDELPTPNPNMGPHRHRFLSKVVASHFGRIKESYINEKSTEKYTEVSDGDLVNQEHGYVISFDISGFGKSEAAARLLSFHPTESGEEMAQSFRSMLSRSFLKFFQTMNILQFSVSGDGFLAGIPYRTIADNEAFFADLSNALKALIGAIHGVNFHMRNSGEALGIRAIIVDGVYRYGKVAGLSSLRAEFDGPLLIDAARLDDATKQCLSPEERSGQLVVASYSSKILDAPIVSGCEKRGMDVDVKEKRVQAMAKIVPFNDLFPLPGGADPGD